MQLGPGLPAGLNYGAADVLLWGAKLEVGTAATGYDALLSEAVVLSPTSVTGGGPVVGTLSLSSPARRQSRRSALEQRRDGRRGARERHPPGRLAGHRVAMTTAAVAVPAT